MSTPVVLITGALTGIGRATAIAFAKEGARLVVSGRKEAEGKALEAELRGLGAESEDELRPFQALIDFFQPGITPSGNATSRPFFRIPAGVEHCRVCGVSHDGPVRVQREPRDGQMSPG